METGARGSALWILLLAGVILVLAVFLFVPFWRCPMCDREIRVTTDRGAEVQGFYYGLQGSLSCKTCGDSRRASLVRRWRIREESRRIGLTFPLFR